MRVTGRDDANQDGNVSYAIETTASSSDVNYNNITVGDVTVTNVDNDTAGITVTPLVVGTTEAGGTAAFNVVLNTQPIADVTVTLTGNSAEGTLSTSTLTFTPLNWNTAQTVTVTGREDAVDDGDITYTIQTTATSSDANYSAIAVPDVAVTNADNDTAGVIISPLTTTATEDGTTGSYSIVLASQPTADVTVRINNGGQTSTSATTLIFTAANWNQAQTVTVTAVDDSVVEGNHSATIAHSIESTDARYSGLAVPSVTANLTDNDTAGVLITPASGSLAEGGATQTYQVVLSSQPIADVTVATPTVRKPTPTKQRSPSPLPTGTSRRP
ncbi:MAG: hypothetical protein HC895_19780 [Leptolyngbyaceae cyanobacterium SM1_3_5]|nr:hypothetical protein [Leptolyngbyaceae cyanobacterium SM1_3_5]